MLRRDAPPSAVRLVKAQVVPTRPHHVHARPLFTTLQGTAYLQQVNQEQAIAACGLRAAALISEQPKLHQAPDAADFIAPVQAHEGQEPQHETKVILLLERCQQTHH